MRASATPEISAPASYPLPIEELVTEAINNNLELRSYEAELGVARGERRQAGMWKNPEFEGNYAYRRVSDAQELLTGEGVSRGLAIVQTFEFPGKGSLRKAIANQNIRLAELGVQQFRQALAGQVRSLGIQWIVVRANAKAHCRIERTQPSSPPATGGTPHRRPHQTPGIPGHPRKSDRFTLHRSGTETKAGRNQNTTEQSLRAPPTKRKSGLIRS